MPASMTITPLYAWQNAERRLFDYLVTAVGGSVNETAFLEEYGKFAPNSEFWKFCLTNPTSEQTEPMPFWTFGAVFEGVYKSRPNAQQAWGRLAAALKRTVNCDFIEGIVSMRFQPGEPLDRVIMQENVDTSATGGEGRRWIFKMPLIVNFQNTEPEIAGESNDEQNN